MVNKSAFGGEGFNINLAGWGTSERAGGIPE